MKKMILGLVAALTLGGAIAPAAVDAQPPARHTVTTTTTTVHTSKRGWRRPPRGWRNRRRVCRWVWRGHRRVRVCRVW